MKLYRFSYSPYARKVEMLLALLGRSYERVEVSYSDRSELARVTGGYIYVPVWVSDGQVTVESRRICERLLAEDPRHSLTPSPFEGPVWAYADFCDGPLEDVLFRIASPQLRERKADPGEQALFTLIKERKFGAGCIEQWQRDRLALLERGRRCSPPPYAPSRRSRSCSAPRPRWPTRRCTGTWPCCARPTPACRARSIRPSTLSWAASRRRRAARADGSRPSDPPPRGSRRAGGPAPRRRPDPGGRAPAGSGSRARSPGRCRASGQAFIASLPSGAPREVRCLSRSGSWRNGGHGSGAPVVWREFG